MPRILKNLGARMDAVRNANKAKSNNKTSTDTKAEVLKLLGNAFEKVEVG